MAKYNWTSTSVIFDQSPVTSPFFAMVAKYVERSILSSDHAPDMQMYTFPINSLEPINFDGIVQQISGLNRSTSVGGLTYCMIAPHIT